MLEMGTRPASLYLETTERPAEAMQPHSAQTGRPPNWQGSMRVDRSAETHVVVCAKRHWLGDCGGPREPARTPAGVLTLGKSVRSALHSATPRRRGARGRPLLPLFPPCC